MIGRQIKALDDHALVLRVAGGEIRAFEAIYDRYSAQAYGMALRVTGNRRAAEEVTQDAFLSLWRTARSYDTSRAAVRTWLLSIARNRSIDWLRREARHDRNVDIADVPAERLQSPEQMEAEVAEREQSERAGQLVAGLPAEQRQVIELAYFRRAHPDRDRGQAQDPARHGQGQTAPCPDQAAASAGQSARGR
jgi:RNA polymerase sigma-70 factor (ECF subfamily)